MFNHLAIFEAHTVHHSCDTLRREQTHQIIFERNEEYRRTRISLTTGTTTQLAVDTTGFVTLRTDDSQTTGLTNFGAQLDIGTTTCHISSNGYCSRETGLSNN